MIILDSQNFKKMFVEFKDVEDSRVTYWINFFTSIYDYKRFAQFWERGCYLYVAHNLYIELRLRNSITTDEDGNVVVNDDASILASGNLISDYKSTGPLVRSKGYNNRSTAIEGQGQWGTSIYGQQFFQLLKMVGMGVIYVPNEC